MNNNHHKEPSGVSELGSPHLKGPDVTDFGRLTVIPPPFRRSTRSQAKRELAGLAALTPAWVWGCLAGGKTALTVSCFLFGGILAGAWGWRRLTGENWKVLAPSALASAMLMFFLVPAGLAPWLAGASAGLGLITARLLRGGPGGAVPAALWGGVFMAGLKLAPLSGPEYLYLAGPGEGYLLWQSGLLLLGAGLLGAGGYHRETLKGWGMLAAASLAFTAAGRFTEAARLSLATTGPWWPYILSLCLFLAPQIKPWPGRPLSGWGLSLAGGLALGWLSRAWGGWSGLLLLTALALAAPWLDDLTSPKPFGG